MMAHGALPALALITLAMVAIYGHIFAGEVAGDDLTFHMAESARIADCLRVGDFDFWNPSANAGFASAYYYQVVPQLVSAIPAAVFGHHIFFFQLSVFLPLVLAPAAAYRGMRVLGATPWQSAIAALAVGFTNGESRWGTGNAGTFNVGLYTQTWALAAFPIALGHAARWATEARGLAPAIAWGAFVTLCHPFAGVALGVALVAAWAAQFVLAVADAALAVAGRHMVGDPARSTWSAAVARLGERWRNPPPRRWRGELDADLAPAVDRLRRLRRLPAPGQRRDRPRLRHAAVLVHARRRARLRAPRGAHVGAAGRRAARPVSVPALAVGPGRGLRDLARHGPAPRQDR
jgi:hypothetical protein